ncbi:MAG: hypothetical protein GY703_01830 [Gammaproteobacteria bacterium]|nr:hypothetical protein [Gammaproteobacteria bacterium]
MAQDNQSWLQLRRLNSENQYKLDQQQRFNRAGSPTSAGNQNFQSGLSRKKNNPLLPDQTPAKPPASPSRLNSRQQFDQRMLQDNQRRRLSLSRQQQRTRAATESNSYRPRNQNHRFRLEQQQQLNRMGTQSRLNSRRP